MLFPWQSSAKTFNQTQPNIVARPDANALGLSPDPVYAANTYISPVDGRFLQTEYNNQSVPPNFPINGRENHPSENNPRDNWVAAVLPDAGSTSGKFGMYQDWQKNWYGFNHNIINTFEQVIVNDWLLSNAPPDVSQVYIDENGNITTLMESGQGYI